MHPRHFFHLLFNCDQQSLRFRIFQMFLPDLCAQEMPLMCNYFWQINNISSHKWLYNLLLEYTMSSQRGGEWTETNNPLKKIEHNRNALECVVGDARPWWCQVGHQPSLVQITFVQLFLNCSLSYCEDLFKCHILAHGVHEDGKEIMK